MEKCLSLSDRVSGIAESITLAVTQKAKAMKEEGVDIVSFAAGEPDFDTPDSIKSAAIQAIESGQTKYTPASGTMELRKAIAAKLQKDNSLDYEAADVIVSCGAKHSLYNIIQAICQKGDEVLSVKPYWVSYPEMVRLAEAHPIEIETSKENGYRLTPNILRNAITSKTKALILNSPSNPAGIIYTKEELQELADVALEKNIYIISDEIYESLIYDGKMHISIASLSNEIKRNTFTVNGMSKSFSMTGWRIGYAVGPSEVMKAIGRMQSHATSNPTSISQAAALSALDLGKEYFRSICATFEERRDILAEHLNQIKGFDPIIPGGAFYIFCDISEFGLGSVEFAQRLLEEAQVAVVPGIAFGSDNCVRFSFATSKEIIEKGMARIKKWAS